MKKLRLAGWAACLLGVIGSMITFAVQPAAAMTATTPTMRYVALGDSIAAGAGLPLMMDGTAEDTACGRSASAYPHLVAQYLHTTSFAHIACGGATASNLYNSQTVGGNALAPQIDAAFANGRPDVITLTIGANDLGWSSVVGQCYRGGTCGSTAQNIGLTGARAYLRAKLAWALFRIDQKSGFNMPKVIVTGYFAPFAADKTCMDTHGLTAANMQWLNGQEMQLSQAIKSVATVTHLATYVQPDFTGHELCSSSPWIQGLTSPAPFHPTAAGQQAIANTVEAALAL